jgi:glyoxylase-like metal-dependent hydrolase (beta-lactamase superfamily II)
MEVIPGVHTIEGLSFGRSYIYEETGRLTLIDTSMPSNGEKIFAAIERLGRRPDDVRRVIVTHCHVDHAGSLAAIVERTGAEVLVHALDAPVLRGEEGSRGPNPRGALRLLTPLLRLASRTAAPVPNVREVADGEEIDLDGGARLIHVPGHTMGSLAVYVPSRRVLFTGDAAANVFGLKSQIGFFTEDYHRADASFAILAELDFEVACFGHGKPLDKAASTAFRRLAEKL